MKKKILPKSEVTPDVNELFNKEDLSVEDMKKDKVSKEYEVKFS